MSGTYRFTGPQLAALGAVQTAIENAEATTGLLFDLHPAVEVCDYDNNVVAYLTSDGVKFGDPDE